MHDASVTAVIYNPAAGAGRVGRRWAQLEAALRGVLGDVVFLPTAGVGGGAAAADAALQRGYTRLFSLGGDGTHNEVVNGVMRGGGSEAVSLALLPAGTGGDFARMFGLPRDPVAAATHALAATPRALDVGRMQMTGCDGTEDKYFVNIASFGMSGLVDKLVNEAPKTLGGRASFFIGTLRALARYKPATVRVTIDGQTLPDFQVNVMAVANGRYFGGGMFMAPDADPGDGFFDVVAIEAAPPLRALRLAPRIYNGTHIATDLVRSFRAREVVAETVGPHPAYIDLDGEAPGTLPATFTMVPRALTLLA